MPIFKKENILLFLSLAIFLLLEIGVFGSFPENYFPASLFVSEQLSIKGPNGGEEWKAGEENQITWFSKGIDKVGIVLFEGPNPKWIAKDVDAKQGFYDWTIFSLEDPSQNYKIAVFKYPWQKGNKISYSAKPFTIIGPKYASCDSFSISAEYPYVPSNFPGIKKVFATNTKWEGNLEGLDGADKKCQQEAENETLTGTWKALLGDDKTLAQDRLNLDGMFVEATSVATLPNGDTCHRLLGETFDKFFGKLSNAWVTNREKLSEDYLKYLSNVWLGRIKDDSPKNCSYILSDYPSKVVSENYSYSTTCENWTQSRDRVLGYPQFGTYTADYPKCYTQTGKRIDAVGVAGLAAGLTSGGSVGNIFSPILAKECSSAQRLICIQQ